MQSATKGAWLSIDAVKAMAVGYSNIKKVKIEGTCYEVYAFDKNDEKTGILFIPLAGSPISVSVGPVTARLVPSLIQNIVRNLIENSIKHAGRDVDIVVAVGEDSSLTVSDDGSGFVPGEARGEFGLGLTIVERIAELHDATLSIRSG